MKKGKKKYVIFIISIIVYCIIFVVVYNTYWKKSQESAVIVFDNSDVYYYENEQWDKVARFAQYKDYDWKKFRVYYDNKYLDNYYLLYNDKWYVFDNNKQAVIEEGRFLATGGTKKLDVASFLSEEITSSDDTYINRMLADNNLPTNANYTVNNKIVIDLDKDGKEETIYTLSNIFPLNTPDDIIFSIVFLRKDDNNYLIYKKKTDTIQMYNECKPYINSIIDLDFDKNYEIVMSCGYYSDLGTTNNFYKFTGKEHGIQRFNMTKK